MCDAVTAISAISAVVGYMGQQEQASREASANAQNYQAQLAANAEQQRQIDVKATDDMSQRAHDALIERGRLNVIGAESGLTGSSADRITQESYFNQGYDIAAIESNRVNSIRQSNLQRDGLYTTANTRAAAIKQPSLLGAGLTIAGTYAEQQAKKPASTSSSTSSGYIDPINYSKNYG